MQRRYGHKHGRLSRQIWVSQYGFCNSKERQAQHMKINIIGRQLNVYDDTKALIEEKLAKLDKFFGGEGNATVTLTRSHGNSLLEITIKAAGTLFRSEVEADSFRDALDRAVENIERQIRKNKTKLKRRLRDGGIESFGENLDWAGAELDEEETVVIKKKRFEYTPMSVEEAILQMNLLGHSFFVFNDPQTDKTCVVYKRKDGNYGLIEPEK